MGDREEHFGLDALRGTAATFENKVMGRTEDDDLNALAELVPDVKNRKNEPTGMMMEDPPSPEEREVIEVDGETPSPHAHSYPHEHEHQHEHQHQHQQGEANDSKKETGGENLNGNGNNEIVAKKESFVGEDDSSSEDDDNDINDVLYAGDDANSEQGLSDNPQQDRSNDHLPVANNNNNNLAIAADINISSAQSQSTATQTHEVKLPMYLPTFKPATGCTNASDFIVRCFVARLRQGITVVKHGRSRWCKSRLRVLHIHPDGRSLSWKPAQGEPHSPKRPPKLDLTTCEEVRHAWSVDPQNQMYTGTTILRQKCEAANAHKSFALIFPKRTVDITSVTADQCKVLMEGFSALCFRLQVANLAGKGTPKTTQQRMPEEEDRISNSTSATLTNNTTQIK